MEYNELIDIIEKAKIVPKKSKKKILKYDNETKTIIVDISPGDSDIYYYYNSGTLTTIAS